LTSIARNFASSAKIRRSAGLLLDQAAIVLKLGKIVGGLAIGVDPGRRKEG
jgi:hypothetical protein